MKNTLYSRIKKYSIKKNKKKKDTLVKVKYFEEQKSNRRQKVEKNEG